jgi:hypothetical protein
MKYLFVAAFSLMLCFVAQHLALRTSGGRTIKSESNFFSSIGRIQAGTVGTPEVMLLGSSITGRLPDRANGFEGFANMGCDGGSAVDALRAMDRGILPTAPLLVVEANTLGRELNGQASEVAAAMEGGWFRVGMKVPALGAYARPAAFFYSILLARRTGDFGDPASGEDLKVSSLPMPLERNAAVLMTPAEAALKEELVAITCRLKEKGCEVVFVWLPPARGESEIPDWIHALIAESSSLWWDLGNEADPSLVTLTDSVHMAAPSAARTLISLRNGLLKR